jgi:hypothetical protein
VADFEHPNVARWSSFVREMATNSDLVTRILVAHVPDPDQLCALCTRGGYGTPCVPWPCSIWHMAEDARRFRQTLANGDTPAGRRGSVAKP